MDNYFLTRDYRQAAMAFASHLGISASSLEMKNIVPYEVQLHTPLVSGTNSYNVLLKGSGNHLETNLVAGDLFMAYGMAISLTKYNVASPTRNKPLLQCPDPGFFPANEIAALEAVYGGDITLTVGDVNRIMKFKSSHFRYAPAAGYVGGHAALTALAQYGPSFEERGFFLPANYPVFSGDDTNSIQLNLPNNAVTTNIGGTAANENILVFQLTGFKYAGSNKGPGSCQI